MEKFFKALWLFLKSFFGFKEEDEATTPPPEATPPKEDAPSKPGVRVLEKGMKGDDVLAAQKLLNAHLPDELDIDEDGEFGNETENAVLKFQAMKGVGRTGAIGPQTLAELEKKPLPPSAGPATQTIMRKVADVAEVEGKKNLVYTGMKSEAEKFLASVRKIIGMPTGRFAWCGGFVFWCCKEGGANIPAAFPTGYTVAYCPGWEAWAIKKGYWHPASDKNFNPQRGDIVLFNWDGDAFADHIGIVLAYDRVNSPTRVKTAEGNTSGKSNNNGDQTSIRARDWANIRGFIRFPAA